MNGRVLNVLIVLFGLLGTVQPAPDSSCNSQWQGYNRCMKQQLSKSKDYRTGLPKPYNAVSTNVQVSNIRSCFKDNNCKDPLAPEASSRARGICFPPALTGLRNDLQACVKKTLSNFQLPEDEFSASNGTNDVLYLLAATAMQNVQNYCSSNVNQQTILSCVSRKYASSGLNAPAPSSQSYCDSIRNCKSVSLVSDKCWSGWNDVLCPCTQSMRFLGTVTKYENQYIDCMKRVGVTVDKSSDPALAWFDTSVKGFCDSSSSTRGTNSWAPGNGFCTATTTSTTTTTTTTTTTPPPEEETPPSDGGDQETTPGLPEEETTPPSDENQKTTERTWFFDNWTFQPDDPSAPTTTTTAPPTTQKSNWPSFFQDYLGIQDPREGLWGSVFNPNTWLKPTEGKRK